MDHQIAALAAQHRSTRPPSPPLKDAIHDLYRQYVKHREQSLIDAIAAAAALGGLSLSDPVEVARMNPQIREAFELAYPTVAWASLAERSPEEITGFMTGWKGKYFEVLVRDKLNHGEWVGDLHLGASQTAILADSPTNPGWDLQILNVDGSVAGVAQLKATDSLGYVKDTLERYPHIDVITTDEVLDGVGNVSEQIFSSGFSNAALEESIRAPMEEILDSSLENVVESVLPGLPFIVIAVGEGRKVLLGRKSFELAMADGLKRATKTGISIGTGALVYLLDGGLLSIPASFLTRLGMDRLEIMRRIGQDLDKEIATLRSSKREYPPLGPGRHRPLLGPGPAGST